MQNHINMNKTMGMVPTHWIVGYPWNTSHLCSFWRQTPPRNDKAQIWPFCKLMFSFFLTFVTYVSCFCICWPLSSFIYALLLSQQTRGDKRLEENQCILSCMLCLYSASYLLWNSKHSSGLESSRAEVYIWAAQTAAAAAGGETCKQQPVGHVFKEKPHHHRQGTEQERYGRLYGKEKTTSELQLDIFNTTSCLVCCCCFVANESSLVMFILICTHHFLSE